MSTHQIDPTTATATELADVVRQWAAAHPDADLHARGLIATAAHDASTVPEVTLNEEGRFVNPRTGKADIVRQADLVPVDYKTSASRDPETGEVTWATHEGAQAEEATADYFWTQSDFLMVCLPEDWQEGEAY